MSDKCSVPFWVCVDCMLEHANGEYGEREAGSTEPLPWKLYEGVEGHATMGLLASEHNEECEVFKLGEWPVSYECDCEMCDFSPWSCDGCGSTLGGTRHAFTWWWSD